MTARARHRRPGAARRSGRPWDDARGYLEPAVFPELRSSAVEHGGAAGMTPDELAECRALLYADSERYALREPGYFVMHPTLLVTARRAHA